VRTSLRKRLRRCVFYTVTTPFFAFSRRHDRKLLATATTSRCGNLDLRCAPELGLQSATLFDRIVEAVDLVQEVDTRRFQWIWSGMSRFYVSSELLAQYWSHESTCILNASRVLSGGRADIAATIVHEATHARLCRAGVFGWPDIRQRLELICVREEIRFFRRLGDAGWNVDARLDWYEKLMDKLGERNVVGVDPNPRGYTHGRMR
jgi:hypothetical protein